jgi:hypothetical protein
MGLAVAYQVLHSYSLDISYEKSLNAAQSITELEVLVRVASPETLCFRLRVMLRMLMVERPG